VSDENQMSFDDLSKQEPRELPTFKAGDRVRVMNGPPAHNGERGTVLQHVGSLVSVQLDGQSHDVQWTDFYADEVELEAHDTTASEDAYQDMKEHSPELEGGHSDA
jgi:hypothetical protein